MLGALGTLGRYSKLQVERRAGRFIPAYLRYTCHVKKYATRYNERHLWVNITIRYSALCELHCTLLRRSKSRCFIGIMCFYIGNRDLFNFVYGVDLLYLVLVSKKQR